MKRMVGIGLGLGLLLAAGASTMGCSSPEEDSCNIKTAGIYVEYEVFEEGPSARTRATFWVGNEPGGTILRLGSCGDAITVNGQTLSEKESGGDPYYEATMAAADTYEYIFEREDEDPYTSSVSARPPVNITGPTAGEISRAEAFDVSWEANDSGTVELLIEGDCIKDFPNVNGDDVPDNGSYTVNAGDIEPFVSSDETESCTATIELRRGSSGSLDGSLKGTIKAESIGRSSFTSTP